MTQDELKLVLEALEYWDVHGKLHQPTEEAITAIKEALAKEKTLQALHDENERLGLYKDAYAEQEPVATVEDNSQQWKGMDGAIAFHLIERHADNWSDARKMMEEWLSANTTSPQRTWVGLTEEEIDDLRDNNFGVSPLISAVEAKLKERNT